MFFGCPLQSIKRNSGLPFKHNTLTLLLTFQDPPCSTKKEIEGPPFSPPLLVSFLQLAHSCLNTSLKSTKFQRFWENANFSLPFSP